MPLKSEIRILNEILPSSAILTVPVRCSDIDSNETSSKSSKSNLNATTNPFILHAATNDSLYLSFSPSTSVRHRINCQIQDGYPREPPLWFTDIGDEIVDSIINAINEMNSLPHLLLDMVKTLVKSLCNAYQLPIPSFMQQLDLDDAFEESDDDDTHPHKNHHQGKGDRDISGTSASGDPATSRLSSDACVSSSATDFNNFDEGDNLEDLQDLSDDDDSADIDLQISDDESCPFSPATDDKDVADASLSNQLGPVSTNGPSTTARRAEGELSQEHLAVLARVQLKPSLYNIAPAKATSAPSSSSPAVSAPSSRTTPPIRTEKSKKDTSSSCIHATDRLMKELRDVFKSQNLRKGVFSVCLEEDNLYEWNVQLHQFDEDSALAQDLVKYKQKQGDDFILLNVTFNSQFPFTPPFVRVVKPPIIGGFVLPGGAICMELLTTQGWSSAYSMESVILQVQATITKGKARINFDEVGGQYTMLMAIKSFMNLESLHAKKGWRTAPKWEG